MTLNEFKIAATHFTNDYEEIQHVAYEIINNVTNEVLSERMLLDTKLQFERLRDDLIDKLNELQLDTP